MLEPTPAKNKGIFSGARRERERCKYRKEAFACFEAPVMPRPLAVPIISKHMALVCAEGIGFRSAKQEGRLLPIVSAPGVTRGCGGGEERRMCLFCWKYARWDEEADWKCSESLALRRLCRVLTWR